MGLSTLGTRRFRVSGGSASHEAMPYRAHDLLGRMSLTKAPTLTWSSHDPGRWLRLRCAQGPLPRRSRAADRPAAAGSTLRRYVTTLGGELEVFDNKRIALKGM
jgi:hypothetical protein